MTDGGERAMDRKDAHARARVKTMMKERRMMTWRGNRNQNRKERRTYGIIYQYIIFVYHTV